MITIESIANALVKYGTAPFVCFMMWKMWEIISSTLHKLTETNERLVKTNEKLVSSNQKQINKIEKNVNDILDIVKK